MGTAINKASRYALTLIAFAWPGWAAAHGGGLNADGCHVNRKTGDYHCHRPPAESSPSPAAQLAMHEQPSPPRAFANCAAARAAGAAPIRRGEPGDGPHLDRDRDGIACESGGRRR